MSKKMTLSADGLTATVAEATMTDILTTVIDSNVSLTGAYKFMQTAGLVVVGMGISNRKHSGSFTNFGAAPVLN